MRAFLKVIDLNGCLESGQTRISERVLLIPVLASLRSTPLTLTISSWFSLSFFPLKYGFLAGRWIKLGDWPNGVVSGKTFYRRSLDCPQRRRFPALCRPPRKGRTRDDSERPRSGMSLDGGNRIERKRRSTTCYM